MQLWVSATTATTFAAGATLVDGNSHPLPSWAPDIAYVGTTSLTGVNKVAMADVYGPTTTGDPALMQRAIVRGYSSRRFAVPMRIGSCLSHAESVVHTTKGDVVICLTYRAVGELKR